MPGEEQLVDFLAAEPLPPAAALHVATFAFAAALFVLARHIVREARAGGGSGFSRAGMLTAAAISVAVLWTLFAFDLGFGRIWLAFVTAAGIVLAAASPIGALGFFLAGLVLRPWELTATTDLLGVLPRLSAFAAVLVWIAHGFLRGSFGLRVDRHLGLTLAFALALVLSAVASGDASGRLAFLQEKCLPIAVLWLLVHNVVRSRAELRTLQAVLLVSVTGLIGSALCVTAAAPAAAEPLRLTGAGLLGNSNDLAAMVVLALTLCAYPLLRTGGLGARLGTALAVGVLLVGLALTQSRGALLALAVSGFVLVSAGARSRFRSLVLGSLIVGASAVLYVGLDRAEGDLSVSSASRLNYAIAGVRMLAARPLFGVGVGNYPVFYEFFTPEFYEWGRRDAHSIWVQLGAEAGAPGLLLFGALFLAALGAARRLRREYPELLLSLAGYGVTMSFLSHAYLFMPYLLAAVVAAARPEPAREPAPEPEALSRMSPLGVRRAGAYGAALLLVVAVLPLSARAWSAAGAPLVEKPLPGKTIVTSKQIELAGSRGEVLDFLVEIRGKGCRSLRAAGEVPVRFHAFREIVTVEPSFSGAPVGAHLDPLLPVAAGAPLCGSAAGSWYWGELQVPHDLAPGRYTFALESGGEEAALTIALTVWRMTIPERPVLPAYMELSTWFSVLGHHGKWAPGEEELARRYIDLMRQHRVDTLTSVIERPRIVRRGDRVTLDLRTSPDRERSYYAVNLRGRGAWSYFGFPTVQQEGVGSADSLNYLRAVEGAVRELGRGDRALMYVWDEPQDEHLPELARLLRDIRSHAPSLRTLVTMHYLPEFEELVDIFVPVMDEVGGEFPDPSVYRKLRLKGKEWWWYVSCMSHGCTSPADSGTPDLVIERSAAYIRAVSWLSMRFGADAFLYYLVNEAHRHYPGRDPWKSVWDFTGNGDGTLIYPGRPGEHGLTAHVPIPSARLKLWRRASYDAHYVAWMERLERKPSWWNEEFGALVPGVRTFSRDPERYEALRLKAGRYLNDLREW